MPTSDELRALADRVEALTGPDHQMHEAIALASGLYVREKRGRDQREWFYPVSGNGRRRSIYSSLDPLPKYTASLDAAMTLVPDNWAVNRWMIWPGEPTDITLLECRWDGGKCVRLSHYAIVEARAATPALALTAAALRARATGADHG